MKSFLTLSVALLCSFAALAQSTPSHPGGRKHGSHQGEHRKKGSHQGQHRHKGMHAGQH
ncbi:hypothetical protein [Hymenobacter daeguensis]